MSARRLVALMAPLACAAFPVRAAPPLSGATPVEGIEIVAPHDSAVVATYPAQGGAVAPGLLVLKVVFDISMSPEHWGYPKSGAANAPQCLGKPRLLADAKTFVLLCSVAASTAYAVELDAPGGPAFQGAGGRRSPDFTLRFTTTDASPNATLAAAMTAAALRDEDSPLMESGAAPSPGKR